MKVITLVGAVTLLAAPTYAQDTTTVWKWIIPKEYAESLWNYDKMCSKLEPISGHDLDSVRFFGGNVTEQDRFHKELAIWRPDTIVVDTGIIFNASKDSLNFVLAHELLHQLLFKRIPVDSSIDARIREVQDSIHPFYPFGYPCKLLSSQLR